MRFQLMFLVTFASALAGGFLADSAHAGPITWDITTVAQAGTVVDGYTLTSLAYSSLAPNDDFVAYQAHYSQAGVTQPYSGIFASDGSAVAVGGQQIGGKTLTYVDFGPYVNDSHSIMFEAANTAGYDDIFTGTSLLSGDSVTRNGTAYYHSGILGFSDSGAFLGDYESCCTVSYFGDASGPLYAELYSGNPFSAASNNSGAGVYNVGNNLYDLQSNLLAAPGTVIAGYTLSSVGFGGTPVAINNSGTVAFVGFWNAGANCGIFTLTTLVADISGNCGVTGININDNGEVAWLASYDLYTDYGLVTSVAANVGARFLNDEGDLTFEDLPGQIELATEVSSAPEPGTVWLALGAAALAWCGRGRMPRSLSRHASPCLDR